MRSPRGLLVLFWLSMASGPMLAGCHARGDAAAWRASFDTFHQQRLESIVGEDGWITLVGRLWLSPGENRFGADDHNQLVLPVDRAPAFAGTITLTDGRLHAVIAPGVRVTVDGQPVTELDLADDRDGKPTVMTLGSLTMRVIKRQDRYALRVKDRAHPARQHFPGLTYYPLDPSLRVTATLEPAPPGRTVPIVNVLGQVEPMPSPGTLRFSLQGVEYTLDAVVEDGDPALFILFRDETAGDGTYPSGRFLYAPPPAGDGPGKGTTELDFNRAFNPPCAFTAFATCPVPPRQNHLHRRIEAGERYTGTH